MAASLPPSHWCAVVVEGKLVRVVSDGQMSYTKLLMGKWRILDLGKEVSVERRLSQRCCNWRLSVVSCRF